MKKIIVGVVVLLLASCSRLHDTTTMDQMISWNTSDFENTTISDVQKAMAKVFLLSQGELFYISPTRTGMRVKLFYTWHYGLGYIKHSAILDYTFTQDENNTVHADIICYDKYIYDFMLMFDFEPEGPIHNQALNDLIFKRINYFLGKTDQWYTCDEYEEYMKDHDINGSINPLCRFYHDITPTSPKGQEILKDLRLE